MKPIFSALALLGLASPAFAAVAFPYSNDFSSTVADFTENTDPHWALNSGAYVDTVGNNAQSAATVEVSGRGATQNFQLQTTFTLSQLPAATSVGFAVLSTGPATSLGVAGTNYYLADVSQAGTLRLGVFTGTTFDDYVDGPGTTGTGINTFTGTDIGVLSLTETYTMTLTGIYTGSALTMTFSVFDGTNTRTLTSSSFATPLAGNNFGLRNRNGATSGTTNLVANFDNFSVTGAIPEPSALVIAGGAGLLALLRRRRS